MMEGVGIAAWFGLKSHLGSSSPASSGVQAQAYQFIAGSRPIASTKPNRDSSTSTGVFPEAACKTSSTQTGAALLPAKMRTTAALCGKGFWGRSMDEFKRLSNIALTLEGIKGPSGPKPLHSFRDAASIADTKLMCDVDIGGYSKASLDWEPATAHEPAHARFAGSISTALPPHRPDIQRSGFAAWRTLDRPPTLFGRALWDIDMYRYLALRVKSDGRAYFVNVQTESVVPTDLHQHRLFAKRPGEWETVLIKWNDFVRTNHGFVVEPQTEILRQKVKSLGIGLTDRVPGPFELCIESMWATNDAREADSPEHEHEDEHERADAEALAEAAATSKEGQLKSKSGKKVKWSE
ncbi:hypothetical protein JX265_008302 [Neoarthrinium moseri]|uniref:NADH:ubiquinone oxidoreductase intermediate-associated protein 30 domain-containing protein n=1 Tax=Neoarthrinium moseri TaxID=1658444 RepID=A0A9P9WIK6_9PEZI|nr:hypothetical protein JX265_008302 [Neoarthrinium moseri]